ncbi:ATP-grasp domain-containing protein [uncultured Shewanella sp.]|uniref:ATP-grasp domain-containing protein n=1 Tax=uncultured Shewanella sp. TaxID=173975 RepID=UPI0026199915|nr:ATP-grasp domain-containing protein [uncultured Shewanella sp.]
MKNKALLILAHQGRSYIKDIRRYLDLLNVKCIILSSKPRDERDLALLKEHSEKVWVLETDCITEDGLFETLKQAQNDFEVVNTLATFEAYRVLMAKANQTLSGSDVDTHSLMQCMDKHSCRQTLFNHGLSHVRSELLEDESQLLRLKQDENAYFIKPRRGAGSFACFRLTDDITLTKLAQLKEQMRSDKQFAAIFNGQFDFIAEGYIRGDEFSFETFVIDEEVYVVGVHAKYVEEQQGTTLEVSNSLPALNLTNSEQLQGEAFITRCLAALNLKQGAYHIETRYDRDNKRWEVIEVNTRMGGALINQSVEVFTGGESFLKLWIELLCGTNAVMRTGLKEKMTKLRESRRRAADQINAASVFISRYGLPGKTLSHLSIDKVMIKPDIIDMPVRVGTTMAKSERGLFLCNALWKVDIDSLSDSLDNLPLQFDAGMEVAYDN